MRSSLFPRRLPFFVTLTAAFLAGCAPCSSGRTNPCPGPEHGAPAPEAPEPPVREGYTAGDVAFMQDMLTHHQQALVMTALVPERTERDQLRQLARRIDISQESEMALMRRWLERRGEAVPDIGDATAHRPGAQTVHHHGMPGMASPEELQRLAEARGEAFDRLFLELMIRHHEGALVMVEELLATEGAGQEPELFQFAAHVDADQRAEIARMRALLETM